jgi:hypothetical protein
MSSEPRHAARVVLLGASNLTRGISTVIESSRQLLGAPLQVLGAMGHGRAYTMPSSMCGRRLPAILDSGLWSALRGVDRSLETRALVTDVGNDLMYGASPDALAAGIEECIDRLQQEGASVVLTGVPLESILDLGPRAYRLARLLFFPTRRVSYESAMTLTRALHERIEDVARRRGAALVRPLAEWYGLDGIHIRVRRWSEAWGTVLHPWSNQRPMPRARGSLQRWLRLRSATPQRWWLLGRPMGRDQPARRMADGTAVSLF